MTLDIIQFILAILVAVAILIQSKNAGLGSIFGGSDGVQTTRRGVEKKLHITTIIISILFFAVSLANVLF